MRPTFILLCTTFLSAWTQDEKPTASQLRKIVADYVAAKREDRPAILAKIGPGDAIKKGEIKSWTQAIWAELDKKPRYDGRSPAQLAHPEYPLRFHVVGTPKPDSPLVIYLHGGGGEAALNDEQWNGARKCGLAMGFGLAVSPRVYEDKMGVGWIHDSAYVGIEEILDMMKRTYKVDTNRVFLGGYSMGGWGAMVVGPILADRLAGVFSMAGGTGESGPALLPNMRNSAYAIHIGEKDQSAGSVSSLRNLRGLLDGLRKEDPGGFKVQYKEYPGVGHQLPRGAHAEIGQWLLQHTRNPYPEVVHWRPHPPWLREFHWLGIETHRKGIVLRAELKKRENRIEVRSEGTTELTVFLNDEMLDLARPVTISVNGEEKFSGKVSYSLSALVRTLVNKQDPKMYFTAKVEIRR
jgi:predicted esterase